MTRALFLACLALALCAAPAGAAGAAPQAFDVDVQWNPSTRVLDGTSAITVANTGTTPLSRVWLRLWPNSHSSNGATDCARARERITAVSGGRVGEYRTGCSAVAIDLAAPVAPGARATFTLTLTIDVPPKTLPKQNAIAFGRERGVDMIGNALPVVAVEDDRGLHVDTTYALNGESDYNLVADWRVRLRVPKGLQAVMSGAESSATAGGVTTFTSRARVRDVVLAVGTFATKSVTVGGVRLRALAANGIGDAKLAKALDRAKTSFSSYQDWYGGYDLPDLDLVVGDFTFSGEEYPGVVFTSADMETVSHEVAHEWFYGLVGNDQFHDPWLDESFATYHEVYFTHDYDCDPNDPIGDATHGLAVGMDYWSTHDDEYDDVIYGGGACALERLRRDIGTNAFRAVLRREVTDFRGRVARTSDFLDEVRKVAPGYDVDAWARLVGLA